MKIFKALFFGLSLFIFSDSSAQIDSVIVEKYYISEANDLNDTTLYGIEKLPVGSVTYRIYIDLADSCALKKIYGDSKHVWMIASDSVFFNHKLEGKSFGNLIGKAQFDDSPVLPLDTWLSLGHATKTKHVGVLKSEDMNGSILGGTFSNGMLMNSDPDAGIPLTASDGFLTTTVSASYSSNGIESSPGIDSTIFGSIVPGNLFITDSINTAFIQTSGTGATGPTPANRVLIAQLTTKGKISFELNLEIEKPDGKITKYVAKNNQESEILSPYLTYPPACGCTDKKYLEYNPIFSCPVSDSCKTLKVFGCTDPMSCNYDPSANMLLPNYCCYPGNCQDRDISLACPVINDGRYGLYPNPVYDQVTLDISAGDNNEVKYGIYDVFGRLVYENNLGTVTGQISESINLSAFDSGVYMLRLLIGDTSSMKTFFKN